MEVEEYNLEFVDRVLDPVHGFIDLTKVERRIYQLPIFRRLESIKQLSVTNWVFPGAEHTRYIHSLGVMFICDEMARNLKRLDGTPRFNDGQRQILRLAGLLHDIGHYPLSHVTEEVYMDEEKLRKKDPDILLAYHRSMIDAIDKLQEPETPEYMSSRISKPLHHEKMGMDVILSDNTIQKIIKEECPFVRIQDICDIIIGSVENIRDPETQEVNQDLSVMVQLMHSELDADGIDYIFRDASFSGTSYGAFTLGLLLRNLVVSEYNGIEVVGVRAKGISVADQYLYCKYFSYTQVIFNRHVSILELMVKLIIRTLISREIDKGFYEPDVLRTYVSKHENVDDYLKFTDRKFWSCLDNQDAEHIAIKGEAIRTIFNCLTNYKEIPMMNRPGGEMVLNVPNAQEAYRIIVDSPLYKRLKEFPNDEIFTFHSRKLASEIKEEVFREILEKLSNGAIEEGYFIQQNLRRLQEGICIIEPDEDIHLLVDDPRSVMHNDLSATYFFRGYSIKEVEDPT